MESEHNKAFLSTKFLYGEEGSGLYSIRNLACRQAIEAAMPLVLQQINNIALEERSVFTLVDYGTADGGTSMSLIYACVKAIREKYGSELPINVIYEDLPVNDFTSVFKRIQGILPGPPRSYFLDFPNVYVTASGTSFYGQCIPSNSVTLGFSATSMHCLSAKPCDITGSLFHKSITVPEEEEKFRKQAEKDWETILMRRAAELMPGGKMLLVQMAVDEEGQFTSATKDAPICVYFFLSELWKALFGEGIITKDEFSKASFNGYFRTIDEFKKPFISPASPVVKAGLELVSIETKVVPCPYKERWMQENGNAEDYAKDYVEFLRTSTNGVFLLSLSDSRTDEDKSRILDALYQRYEAEVAKNPDDHWVDYVHAYLVIQKRCS